MVENSRAAYKYVFNGKSKRRMNSSFLFINLAKIPFEPLGICSLCNTLRDRFFFFHFSFFVFLWLLCVLTPSAIYATSVGVHAMWVMWDLSHTTLTISGTNKRKYITITRQWTTRKKQMCSQIYSSIFITKKIWTELLCMVGTVCMINRHIRPCIHMRAYHHEWVERLRYTPRDLYGSLVQYRLPRNDLVFERRTSHRNDSVQFAHVHRQNTCIVRSFVRSLAQMRTTFLMGFLKDTRASRPAPIRIWTYTTHLRR